ncbi:MAG: erythromycin esterase family protein [Candidatus Aminicenantes bacterium]|nr:MAG: erythromycin esterase family protein [Candidatus Aminicenantes bacterium]
MSESFFLRLFSIFTLAFLISPTNHVQAASNANEKVPDVDSLRPYVVPIQSIAFEEDDFSDLSPLIEKIGDARIVVLGEATHSEGTTSQAKARLIKFLHQKMGFDVLAWETGFVQCYGMNEMLRTEKIPLEEAKTYLMSGGWASEKAIHPLFEYARSTWISSKPLEMCGFDTGRPHKAASYFKKFLSDFVSRTPDITISEEEWILIDKLTSRGYGFFSRERPDDEERTQQRAVLKNIADKIRIEYPALLNYYSPKELVLIQQFINDALISEHIKYVLQTEGPKKWNYLRDREMAKSFLWILDNLFPERKVIIWAATAHLIRNADEIESEEGKAYYPVAYHMGQHLYARLGNQMYTIAVTAYKGEYGEIFPEGSKFESAIEDFEPAPENSFEAVAHKMGLPYSFTDLRSAPADHWLKDSFVSVALGRIKNKAHWANIFDAFFFIDTAEPISYLPRK